MRVGMMKNTLKNSGKQVFTLSKIWGEITKIQKLIIGLNLDTIASDCTRPSYWIISTFRQAPGQKISERNDCYCILQPDPTGTIDTGAGV